MKERLSKAFKEKYWIQFLYYLIAYFVINMLMNVLGIYQPQYSIQGIAIGSLIFAVLMTATSAYRNKKG